MDTGEVLNNYNFLKWASHVESFMDRGNLFPVGGRGFVALSGGRDSVLLLWTLAHLWRQGRFTSLEALHFNHRTRPQCGGEEDFVRRLCRELEIPLTIDGWDEAPGDNIEQRARTARQSFFKSSAAPGDRVYTAHHLDDSFEWSLLSKFKSGSLLPQLGIPLVNGIVARPFMCVSRQQIVGLVNALDLEIREDDSNRDNRFERNFVRNEILPPLVRRFPKYLSHYVSTSNAMARERGVWRLGQGTQYYSLPLPPAGVALFNGNFENCFQGAEEEIRAIIAKLSDSHRGRLGRQISKLIVSAKRGTGGPFNFSGGVLAYAGPGTLFFVRRDGLALWQEWDNHYLSQLQKVCNKSFPLVNRGELKVRLGQVPFPGLGFGRPQDLDHWVPGRRRAHPLLPRSGDFCLGKNLWFAPLTLLFRKGGKGPWPVLT